MMMPSPGLERAAQVVAENAVLAFERGWNGAGPMLAERNALMRAIVRELLAVMPTTSGEQLAEACNRGLEVMTGTGIVGPRIELVDVSDGSVTMRAR